MRDFTLNSIISFIYLLLIFLLFCELTKVLFLECIIQNSCYAKIFIETFRTFFFLLWKMSIWVNMYLNNVIIYKHVLIFKYQIFFYKKWYKYQTCNVYSIYILLSLQIGPDLGVLVYLLIVSLDEFSKIIVITKIMFHF